VGLLSVETIEGAIDDAVARSQDEGGTPWRQAARARRGAVNSNAKRRRRR
jgi:hypothetical protein